MQPMIRRTSLILLTAVAVGPLARAGVKEGGLPALLSDDTFLFVRADAGGLVSGVKDLDIARLLRDEEMRDFLAPLYEAVPFLSPDDPIGSLWSAAPVLDFVRGEVAFGVSGIGFEIQLPDGTRQVERISPSNPLRARLFHQLASYHENVWIDGQPVTKRGALPFSRFSVDFLLSLEPGAALRGMIHDYLKNPPSYAEIGQIIVGGREVTAINCKIPDGEGIYTTVLADFSGDRWLLGGDQDSFTRALAGGPQRPLSTSASYRAFSERLASGKNVVLAYADLATALKAVSTCLPPIVMEELEILGLDAFRGLGLGVSLVEGGVRESVLLGFDGDAPGLFAALDCFGGGFPSLGAAPSTTGAFFGLRFDVNKLKDSVLGIVTAVAPRMRWLVEEELAKAQVEGWNIVNDILPALGGELSIFASPTNAGPIPDVLVTMDVRDTERFNEIMEFIKGAVASEGIGINPLTLKGGDAGFTVKIPDAPVQPAFAIRDGRLIGAISAFTLKNYLYKHVDNPEAETLANASEVMPKIINGLTGGRPESLAVLAYLDLHSTLPVIYETVAPLMQTGFDEAGIPLDAAMLPLSDTLQPYFTGIALGLTRDAGGVGLHLYTPTGILPAGITAGIAAMIAEGDLKAGGSD